MDGSDPQSHISESLRYDSLGCCSQAPVPIPCINIKGLFSGDQLPKKEKKLYYYITIDIPSGGVANTLYYHCKRTKVIFSERNTFK